MMRHPSLPSPQTVSELVLLYLAYEVNGHRDYSAGKQLNIWENYYEKLKNFNYNCSGSFLSGI